MKRLFPALLAAIMIAAGFGACANSPATSSSSPAASSASEDTAASEDSTAPAESSGEAESEAPAAAGEGVVHFYGSSDMEKTMSAEIAAYEAATGNKVEMHIVANDAYDDKVKVMISGNAPDLELFWLRAPSLVKQYMGNNALENMAPFAEASGVDLSPIKDTSLVGVSDDNGGFYGLPVSGSCWMLFYNKDLFDAKGIDYPINLTWDQYLDLAKELAGEEDGTKYWGGVVPPWTMNLGASAAGEYLTDPEPLQKTQDYSQILHRLYTEDGSHPSLGEVKLGSFDISAAFAAGNIYMMINGDWMFRLMPDYNPGFTYAAAPLPIFEDAGEGASVGQSSYLCISATAANKQGAYDFAEFYTTSDEGTTIIAGDGDVPSYATEAAMAKYQESVTVDGVEYRFSAKVGDEQGTDPNYQDINEAFKQELELYLLDEQTLDETFANFFELRNEITAG